MLFMVLAMAVTPEEKIKVEALYEEYDRLMYYVASRILHSHEDVEDAVMESWIRIIRYLDKINEVICPQTKSFIVIIVERISINIYNKNKKNRDNQIDIDNCEKSPFFSTMDSELSDSETYADLKKIQKKYGEVLILYYMHEMSVKEISQIVGVSVDAVNKRLQRGRELIKQAWCR